MMRIDIITAVPDIFLSPLNSSIISRAQKKGFVEIHIHNLRDYTKDKHKQIDDKVFGGGAGMLLKPEPFFECIEKLLSERNYEHIIFPLAQGKIFEQKDANKFSLANNIIFVVGHYKGIDDRVRERFATDEISIGNFILSGGELPALLMIDAIVRLLPGVLNDSESALTDSFQDDLVISAPDYTRPAKFRGMKVPEILLTGDHNEIKKWREEQSKILTNNWKKINNIME
ncbi:MAG: tRNA (guanosine(37)-N1)-methyltransferase TrmD [Ignavibacterium sp.]